MPDSAESKYRNYGRLSFSILLAVLAMILGARLSIPLQGGIPVSLQTLAILLSAMYLGPVRSFVAVALYILVGIMGAPVFAGGASGLEKVLGPSGGFFLGFLLSAYLCGLMAQNGWKSGFLRPFIVFLLGHVMILSLGLIRLLWFKEPDIILHEIALPLLPGMWIKSLLGAGIVWAWGKLSHLKR